MIGWVPTPGLQSAASRVAAALAVALSAAALLGADASEDKPAMKTPDATIWEIADLEKIGGRKVAVVGSPQVTSAPKGKAVRFDGTKDGLVVEANPLAGLGAFTLEVVFRPESGGPREQRFFHCQEDGSENRAMLETRLTDDGKWYLDTFLKFGRAERALADPKALHPLDEWHAAALVFDGREMAHYVDGAKECAAKFGFKPLGPGRTSIGMRLNQVHWFKGAVRQARFSPRALKPDEMLKP